MHALPTSLSIMCTTLSAITIIGRDSLTLGPDLGGFGPDLVRIWSGVRVSGSLRKGTPAEFYLYGAMYFWMILVYCLSMTLGSRVTHLNIYFPQFQL